jgi:hypothetical protein
VLDLLASKRSSLVDYLAVLPLVFLELAKQGSPTAVDLAQDGFSLVSLLVLEVLEVAFKVLRLQLMLIQNKSINITVRCDRTVESILSTLLVTIDNNIIELTVIIHSASNILT